MQNIIKKVMFAVISPLLLQCTLGNARLDYSLVRNGSADKSIIDLETSTWQLTARPLAPNELHMFLKDNDKAADNAKEAFLPPLVYISLQFKVNSKAEINPRAFYFEDEDGTQYLPYSKEQLTNEFPSPSYKLLRNSKLLQLRTEDNKIIACDKQCTLATDVKYSIVQLYKLPLLPMRTIYFTGPEDKSIKLEIRSTRTEPIEIQF